MLASVLVAFGALAIPSIGFPFFVVGMTLLVIAPFRGRPALFWPVLSAVIAFSVGYVPVAPLTYSAQMEVVEGGAPPIGLERTTCSNVLGIG